jgi:hypothetical protein
MPCAHHHVDATRRRAAGVLLGLLLLSGCDTHEVRISPPPGAAPGEPGDLGFTLSAIGDVLRKDPLSESVTTSPLPLQIPVSCLRREADGTISRYEGGATTPLPWWQRFPADMISDPLPWTFIAGAQATIVLTSVPTADLGALVAQARRDGYAHAGPAKAPGAAPTGREAQ